MKCSHCLQNEATDTVGEGYAVCASCLPEVEPYYHCEICDIELRVEYGEYCRKRFERGICNSAECHKARDVQRGAVCCEQAEYIPCVCARSYKCPVHGEVHVGTHD